MSVAAQHQQGRVPPGSGRPSNPDQLQLRLATDPAGVIEVPVRPHPVIVIHVGPSVYIACDRGGLHHSGVSVHGDVDIVPVGLAARWELKDTDTALIVGVPVTLLQTIAEESRCDPGRVEIVNRFQMRDPQIENIGWALKAELETGYPNGSLYLDSLATGLAVHLLNHHSSESPKPADFKGGLPGRKLKQVLSYIEDNLDRDLSIREIARIAGLSVSHCKTAFRKSAGQPVHRYVIQRRVERARTLLSQGELSISQVALATGFAHQSHLAYHMRRLLGVLPKSVAGRRLSDQDHRLNLLRTVQM
jgi:AraC family transcriptional regulator